MDRTNALPRLSLIATAIAVSVAALLHTPAVSAGPVNPIELRQRDIRELESVVTREIQALVNKQKRIAGQEKIVTVKATIDINDRVIILNLSKGYLPKYNGGEYEDLQHQLSVNAMELLRESINISGVRVLIDGKPIQHYIPDNAPTFSRPISRASEEYPLVAVSAGHGVYFNYEFNDWRAQRDASNGIVEDFVTPGYVTDLTSLLLKRGIVTVANPRSTSVTSAHLPSMQTWYKMAARYNLEDWYPDKAEIWHSLPSDTGDMRERDEDIRSRALFANYINADALLSIHTNGVDNDPSVRGTRVYVQEARETDGQLARSILCYMKEKIQALPAYADWTIATEPHTGNFGETRLANMPAAIVEVAFHTNAQDALAIQDPSFRSAAMKGVEKGYRLFAAGQTDCVPFTLVNIPNHSIGRGYYKYLPYEWKGQPHFPVKARSVAMTCPTNFTCNPKEHTFSSETTEPFEAYWACTRASVPYAVTWRTTLTDADGVATRFDHTLTCT